jgi:hypothetical protein
MAKRTVSPEPQQDLVQQVFDDFLERLQTDASIDAAVVDRLREKLLVTQELSADSLRQALFQEDSDL